MLDKFLQALQEDRLVDAAIEGCLAFENTEEYQKEEVELAQGQDKVQIILEAYLKNKQLTEKQLDNIAKLYLIVNEHFKDGKLISGIITTLCSAFIFYAKQNQAFKHEFNFDRKFEKGEDKVFLKQLLRYNYTDYEIRFSKENLDHTSDNTRVINNAIFNLKEKSDALQEQFKLVVDAIDKLIKLQQPINEEPSTKFMLQSQIQPINIPEIEKSQSANYDACLNDIHNLDSEHFRQNLFDILYKLYKDIILVNKSIQCGKFLTDKYKDTCETLRSNIQAQIGFIHQQLYGQIEITNDVKSDAIQASIIPSLLIHELKTLQEKYGVYLSTEIKGEISDEINKLQISAPNKSYQDDQETYREILEKAYKETQKNKPNWFFRLFSPSKRKAYQDYCALTVAIQDAALKGRFLHELYAFNNGQRSVANFISCLEEIIQYFPETIPFLSKLESFLENLKRDFLNDKQKIFKKVETTESKPTCGCGFVAILKILFMHQPNNVNISKIEIINNKKEEKQRDFKFTAPIAVSHSPHLGR